MPAFNERIRFGQEYRAKPDTDMKRSGMEVGMAEQKVHSNGIQSVL